MEISNNKINFIDFKQIQPAKKEENKEQVSFSANNSVTLPSVHSLGQSQINSNLPVSYNKIAEIPIPGLDSKASVFKLSNGQKVVICPKQGPTYVRTTYNVGSLNETDDIRGVSHYIEHNLFNGSKGLAPREYDKKVSELGGYTNASTSYDYTDYYLSLQLHNDNSLEEAIKLNAMQTQFPTFPQEQLDKEKEPVKSEIDMYLDMPYDVSVSTATKNLFNIQTAATNAVIGTKDTINALTREKVLDYYNTWYTPDNAVTVITGDVDVNETISLVSKYYNKQNDYSQIQKRHYETLTPISAPVREDIIMPNASSASIALAFAVPEGTSKEDKIKLDILLSTLNSQNSKISKALDKYGISADFHTEKLQNKPDAAEVIVCNVNPSEHQVEEVLKIIYSELTNALSNPPTQKDLDGTKKSMLYSVNNTGEESEKLNYNLTHMMLNDDINYFVNKNAVINAITQQDITDTAKKFLDLNKASLCVTHSKDATPTSITDNYNNAKNIALNSSNTSSSTQVISPNTQNISFGARNINQTLLDTNKEIKHYKLQNNIETRILPSPSTTKSTLFIDFDTDELNDVSAPAFAILKSILDRGNAIRDNDTVLQLTQEKDISLIYSVSNDGLCVGSNFYPQDTNETISLIKETLMNPNFTQEEFDRAKQIIKDIILTAEPSANDKLYDELFGKKVKNFVSKEEMLAELEVLTLADIQNLYARIMSTAQVSATINSPIKEYPQLEKEINNNLSVGLPTFKPITKQHSSSYNIYQPTTEAKTLVQANESKQADVVQAYTFKKSQNIDDIAKIAITKYILGGGMSSRLFKDLREDQKLAYSVGATIDSVKDTVVVELYIGTTTESPDPKEGSPENITKALNGFNKHVNTLKNENVTQKELDDAKLKIKTSILDGLETSMDKISNIHDNAKTVYDVQYTEALLDAIDRVNADDVRAAANYMFANPPITSIVASQKTLDTLNLK